MAYEMKDNTGGLFKNDKKEKDTHPDYSGNMKVAGVEYYISGWVKKTKADKPFLSLAIKAAKPVADKDFQLDDEIAF